MVFIIGPRQSGKTWLAKEISKNYKNSIYLNFDSLDDKEIIDNQSWNRDLELIIFDELHKKNDWKNYIKGVFDTKKEKTRILVTGSARLDIYDHVGDSLAGRYFRHRLLPFSFSELNKVSGNIELERLIRRGGFPEPLLAENDMDAARWRQQYTNSILSTDIFEIEQIQNFKALRLLFELLRKRVGSPVSFKSLSEDISVSPNTIKKYIEILEALFVVFRVNPFSKNIARSILKEPKIYFFDSGLIEDEAARFENFMAISLLKSVYFENDYFAKEKSLHYLRTKDGLEVDFAISNKSNLELIIEAKLSEKSLDKNLFAFSKRYDLKALQIVRNLSKARIFDGISLIPAEEFLVSLES